MDLLDFFIGEVSENNASNKDPVNTIAAQLLTIWCLKLAICPWKNLPKPFKIYKSTQQNFCLSYIIMMNLSK